MLFVGLGLNPQVKHSICDSDPPSKGNPSSSSYVRSIPFCPSWPSVLLIEIETVASCRGASSSVIVGSF